MGEDRQALGEITEAIRVLEGAVERFVTAIRPPLFVPEHGNERFRYSTRSSAVLQVLKAVRVVSALNALVTLFRDGFVQEMGVLLRTVDDFLGEITFVHEAHQVGQPNADQRRFVEQFFREDTRSLEEMLQDTERPRWVARKSIYAAEARWLDPANQARVMRMLSAVASVFNRYAHGVYPAIMELYEGGTERFRLRGMLNTPRMPEFRRQIAIYTHRSLNIFALIAMTLDLRDVHNSLLEARRAFEGSVAYGRQAGRQ